MGDPCRPREDPLNLFDELEDLLRAHGVQESVRQRINESMAARAGATTLDPWDDSAPAPEDPWASMTGGEAFGTGVAWSGLAEDGAGPAAPTPAATELPFKVLGRLGEGGMGEVLRVHDPIFDRLLALKVMRPELAARRDARERFVREARATAALEHPGIVPVHTYGVLPDGRPYFTMRQIRGHTLERVIRALHGAEQPEGRPWTRRRALTVFQRICETLAYAHARGTVHRDLKPANVMLGPFGEVLVLDWGLAALGDDLLTSEPARPDLTRVGAVSGTPRYMAPEQARGDRDAIGPRTDVFALGLMLFELLTGRPAYDERTVEQVMRTAVEGTVRDLPAHVPPDLADAVRMATAPDPANRPEHAGDLGELIGAWLDGAERRERARRVVEEASELAPLEATLRQRHEAARRAALALRGTTPTHAPAEAKEALWSAEDEVDRLAREVDELAYRHTSLLEGSLTHAPDLPEALDALAHWHRQRHAAAELLGETELARDHERLLRRYDRGHHGAYLAGVGALSLRTTPSSAMVTVQPLQRRGRHLVPGTPRPLGHTPLEAVPLPMGSYLLTLQHPGHEPVRYPVHITREHHWDGVGPEGVPVRIALPPVGSLTEDDRYVPAGWYASGRRGGNPGDKPWRRVWQPGFVLKRDVVTNLEYIAFLDNLVDHGREAEALAALPRQRAARPGELGAPCYGRDEAGHFILVPDAEGDCWEPDWPVFLVDFHGASAYAAWLAQQTGQPWQLPTEFAWEKAARGVDGRLFPWGDEIDHTFAAVRGSRPGRPLPARVSDFETDVSIFDVRGMAGNVREWVDTAYGGETDEQAVMGGAWFFGPQNARLDIRYAVGASARGDTVGFRVGRRWG